MKILKKDEILEDPDFYIKEIISGKIFIYPTDTVYGIGCVCDKIESVEKIRTIKKRDSKPFLLAIPDINWLEENCEVNEISKKEITDILPGPFSFIVKTKEHVDLDQSLISENGTIGIRILNNWFSKLLKKTQRPFITTSVNFSGEKPAKKIEEIDQKILKQVDYILEDNNMTGKSSTIIDMSGEHKRILRR